MKEKSGSLSAIFRDTVAKEHLDLGSFTGGNVHTVPVDPLLSVITYSFVVISGFAPISFLFCSFLSY